MAKAKVINQQIKRKFFEKIRVAYIYEKQIDLFVNRNTLKTRINLVTEYRLRRDSMWLSTNASILGKTIVSKEEPLSICVKRK